MSARWLKKLLTVVSVILCIDGLKIQYFISKKWDFRHKFRGEQILLHKIIFSQNTSNVSARWLKKLFPIVNVISCTDGLKFRLSFSKKWELRHKFRGDQFSLNKIIFSQNTSNVSARWLKSYFSRFRLSFSKRENLGKFRGEQISLNKIIFSQNTSNVSARWLKKLLTVVSVILCTDGLKIRLFFSKNEILGTNLQKVSKFCCIK